MGEARSCPRCGASDLHWTTLRKEFSFDALQCRSCGNLVAKDDWCVPLMPLLEDRCMNCGAPREADICVECGLTRREDVQVHEELRDLIDGDAHFLDAARRASKGGRRLLALKLATAATVLDDPSHRDVSHALRVWLLASIGELKAALLDAKAWVGGADIPSVLALASLGQQLEHNDQQAAAIELYGQALAREPGLGAVRARKARALLALNRIGQAFEELCEVYRLSPSHSDARKAQPLAEEMADRFAGQNQLSELQRLLDIMGRHVERSAPLLTYRARIAFHAGKVDEARRDLQRAREIDPELPIFKKLAARMAAGPPGKAPAGAKAPAKAPVGGPKDGKRGWWG